MVAQLMIALLIVVSTAVGIHLPAKPSSLEEPAKRLTRGYNPHHARFLLQTEQQNDEIQGSNDEDFTTNVEGSTPATAENEDPGFVEKSKQTFDSTKEKTEKGYSWWTRQSTGIKTAIIVSIIVAVALIVAVVSCVFGCAKAIVNCVCCPCRCCLRFCGK